MALALDKEHLKHEPWFYGSSLTSSIGNQAFPHKRSLHADEPRTASQGWLTPANFMRLPDVKHSMIQNSSVLKKELFHRSYSLALEPLPRHFPTVKRWTWVLIERHYPFKFDFGHGQVGSGLFTTHLCLWLWLGIRLNGGAPGVGSKPPDRPLVTKSFLLLVLRHCGFVSAQFVLCNEWVC